MEFGWITLLRMASAVVVAVLLLSPQLDGNLVSGLMLQLKDCNSISFSYSSTSGDEIFYINENLVDRESFCKELKFHYENGCVFDRYLRNPNCGQDISSVDFFSVGGRKLLQKEVSRESKPVDSNVQSSQSRNDKQSNHSFVSPTRVGLAAAGLFILCCTLLCPCFYKKKKEATDSNAMLGRDLNSMDSTSFENSVSEKVPASPLRVPPSPSRYSVSPKLSRLGSIHFNLSQVNRATNNFSEKMLLGEGGFGRVYKAHLGDGLIVAVKRAKKELFETLQTEFSSEVDLLSKIEHRNLVKLLGYVNQGNERLIITEYVPNGTLRKHLDGQGGRILDFNQRLEIAIDVAHGLTYLHSYAEKQIIHRDVKSSNILLTESLRAKVADFGFARLGPMDSERTHVSTKVKGTVGYLDPEYMRTYQLTTKSDVYSFGILLIEILTGRRPVEKDKPNDERITLRWAFSNYNEGKVTVLVDPLMREYVKTELLVKIFGLAMQCAAPIRTDRPDMRSVGEQLWVIRADYLKSANRG